MPIYLFKNPRTEEIKNVLQKMNDEHVFVDKNGLSWERVFTIPSASIDTEINAFSESDFAEKTKKKNYSVGDLWDKSAELSSKREKILGSDAVKKKSQEARKEKTKKKNK